MPKRASGSPGPVIGPCAVTVPDISQQATDGGHFVNQNAQPDGTHEVHADTCQQVGRMDHLQFVGRFSACRPAVKVARANYPTAVGCAVCSPDCLAPDEPDERQPRAR